MRNRSNLYYSMFHDIDKEAFERKFERKLVDKVFDLNFLKTILMNVGTRKQPGLFK